MCHKLRKPEDYYGVGITYPKTQDVVLYSEKEGKAYGPDRAKWLTASVRGGALIATVNVDCYVYYLVSKFMQDRFGEEVIGPVKF